MNTKISNLIRTSGVVIVILGLSFVMGCSSKPADILDIPSPTTSSTQTSDHSSASQNGTVPQTVKSTSNSQNAVTVVVAGYINHGPMESTVNAIKEVLNKYGDKVNSQWVDLATDEGAKYFKDHNLSAHLNILINGKLSYPVNDKSVTFTWFEGQGWTKQDLDILLSNLVNK
jgi:hypothetical protein